EQRRARLRERDLGLREGLFIWCRRRNTGCSEVPVGRIRRRQLLLRIQRGERLLDKGSHVGELTLRVDVPREQRSDRFPCRAVWERIQRVGEVFPLIAVRKER